MSVSQGGSIQKIGSTLQVREANSNVAINDVNYILFQNQDVGSAHMTDNTLKWRHFQGVCGVKYWNSENTNSYMSAITSSNDYSICTKMYSTA